MSALVDQQARRRQAAGGDERAIEIDRRQLVPGRKRNDQIATNAAPERPGSHQTAVWRAREGRDGALDLVSGGYSTDLTSTLSDGATA